MVLEPGPGRLVRRPDRLALEEPLEVRLASPSGPGSLGVTMRTPGNDMELVAGLLLAEGIVDGVEDLAGIAYCAGGPAGADRCARQGTVAVPTVRGAVLPAAAAVAGADGAAGRDRADRAAGRDGFNALVATLRRPPRRPLRERHTVTSSSCGVCGSASIEALRAAGHPVIGAGPEVPLDWLCGLPDELRRHQRSFDDTGAVHAAGLAEPRLGLLAVREDVGRHNAVDKVVGWALLAGSVPLRGAVLVVSGRVSFEIVQKAVRAGVGVVAAVSGATSLAVALAEDVGVTLVGFVRGGRCTVYTGPERLVVR